MSSEPFLPPLNPRQQEAVGLPIGPALVLAGPGTGKTRVLTERIRHLVETRGVLPEHILAVTFTNKAAAEMDTRLQKILAGTDTMPQTGTFHRFCIGILREHGEARGLRRTFSIADDDLQRTVLYRTGRGLNIDESGLGNVLSNLSRHRRSLREGEDEHLAPSLKEMLRAYQTELRDNNLVDFDDLIFLAHDLLRDRPDILEDLRGRHQHLLVDEFQDTDREQYGIVRLLAKDHRSLFVVADDEQSIYGWRNADPENIGRLQHDFPETEQPVVLVHNYRSSEDILNQARRLINRNAIRYEREVLTDRSGSAVRGIAFKDDAAEGRFIAADIKRREDENPGTPLSQTAVLYPRHAIGAQLERIFMRAGVPCQVSQRRGVFDQPIIRRALSILRYALDGGDDASLENFMRRELDSADPAIYPAIRAHQTSQGLTSFKQAAFGYLREAAAGEALEVERALGLAGVVTSAVQKTTTSFANLVDDILDQLNTGALPSIKNHLQQITDPLQVEGVASAAEGIRPFCRPGATIYVTFPDRGLRHVLTNLFNEALGHLGVGFVPADPGESLDLTDAAVLSFTDDRSDSREPFFHLGRTAREAGLGPALVALKLCQALGTRRDALYLPDYTAFDIETTDLDVGTAEVIEIGAIRVRGGKEVDAFHARVKPTGTIAPGARQTHGISLEEVADAPSFSQVYPEFTAFADDDVLVAHNGYGFDFQVLNAEARRNGFAKPANPTLDTLPMARSYAPGEGHSIDALCERYGIPQQADRHRALHDARYLYQAFEALKRERDSRYRRTAHERLLDVAALAMLFQDRLPPEGDQVSEDAVHFKLGAQRLLGPSNTRIRDLAARFSRMDAERLRARALAWLNEEPRPESLAEHAPEQIQLFKSLVARHEADTPGLKEAIRQFLDFADLYRSEGDTADRSAVNLLTLHAAKGLEFREVYICGLEERSLPNVRTVNSKDQRELEEQRRLLYVGMTRAMDRLTLTCAHSRGGREAKPSRFWEDLGIEPEEMTI